MPYIIPQSIKEKTAPYVFFKDLFTPEECDKIIALSKVLEPQVAKIGSIDGVGQINETKRRTEVFWLHWKEEHTWIFEKLANAIANANTEWWGFHLAGLNEALQLTHYKSEDNGHYDWHEDNGDQGAFQLRKISGTLILNDSFEGGEFEFMQVGEVKEATKGSLILFPSFKTHRVKPVTSGDRWSLVAWVTGPAFI